MDNSNEFDSILGDSTPNKHVNAPNTDNTKTVMPPTSVQDKVEADTYSDAELTDVNDEVDLIESRSFLSDIWQVSLSMRALVVSPLGSTRLVYSTDASLGL